MTVLRWPRADFGRVRPCHRAADDGADGQAAAQVAIVIDSGRAAIAVRLVREPATSPRDKGVHFTNAYLVSTDAPAV